MCPPPCFAPPTARVSKARADILLDEGDVVRFGSRHVRVLSTPGHTEGCVAVALDDGSAVFSGDALLIRGCGRTDFQQVRADGEVYAVAPVQPYRLPPTQGDAGLLYDSVHGKLLSALPPSCLVFPGHDYRGHLMSTIAEEAALNPRLTKPRAEFVSLMAALGLPPPKQIDRAVPANMVDGDIPEAHALEL